MNESEVALRNRIRLMREYIQEGRDGMKWNVDTNGEYWNESDKKIITVRISDAEETLSMLKGILGE